MAILGLLLILAVGGLAADVVVQNSTSISVDAVGTTFSLSPGWLFVAGLAAGVIGLLGVSMLVAGITRARRRRAALAESRTSLQGVQAERDRLAVELGRQRAARTPTADRTRSEDRLAADDENSAVIDLDEEREPVESGRRGLFHRMH